MILTEALTPPRSPTPGDGQSLPSMNTTRRMLTHPIYCIEKKAFVSNIRLMIPVLEFSPQSPRFLKILNRQTVLSDKTESTVKSILTNVAKHGDAALFDYTKKFDGASITARTLTATSKDMAAALKKTPPSLIGAINEAARNIRRFHKNQMPKNWSVNDGDGVSLGKITGPIGRVGVYVPAGTAPLVSTLLMNVIPAQVAGVPEIIVAVPPNPDGNINPHMLAAGAVLKIGRMYKMGGAQAIAALTYGTRSVPAVDKIVGPGNMFVAAAKRLVFGRVGIDSIAGPSEIVVICDSDTRADFAAADMLSQAEHGSGFEAVICLTDSKAKAAEISAQITLQAKSLAREKTVERALKNYGAIFIVPDLQTAAAICNRIAPEHLEILTKAPRRLLKHITNAGAVFLGPWSPEPVGDYFCGTNHVLPTNGTARFSSSLSVADFMKNTSVISYSKKRLLKKAHRIMAIGRAEGLDAHVKSIAIRLT